MISDWKVDKQQLLQLAEELERRGWQADERGDVQCYDQACAMAAELVRDRLNGNTIQVSREEYEALKRDAERYWWLRDKNGECQEKVGGGWCEAHIGFNGIMELDVRILGAAACIDAAIDATINIPVNGEGGK